MKTENDNVLNVEGGRPVKMWTRGEPVEDEEKRQLENVARMPFVFSHFAAMSDVHFGRGATVGSVIATKGAIIPATVGVDIGCGRMAVQTSLKASDLPDSLARIRASIERAVPHGFVSNEGSRGPMVGCSQAGLSGWRFPGLFFRPETLSVLSGAYRFVRPWGRRRLRRALTQPTEEGVCP